MIGNYLIVALRNLTGRKLCFVYIRRAVWTNPIHALRYE